MTVLVKEIALPPEVVKTGSHCGAKTKDITDLN